VTAIDDVIARIDKGALVTNIFNEVGIPAMCYAPQAAAHQFKRAMTVESLYQAACMYARIAVDLCNQDRG
jgi:hypothetical protein